MTYNEQLQKHREVHLCTKRMKRLDAHNLKQLLVEMYLTFQPLT